MKSVRRERGGERVGSTPLLAKAEPLGDYAVRFEGGTAGDVDLSDLVDYGGVSEPLYTHAQR